MVFRKIGNALKNTRYKMRHGLRHHLEKNEGLLKHVILMGIISTIANLFTIGFNIYAARKLIPAEYGALISLVAIIFIFVTTFAAVQITITKFVSHYKVKSRYEEISTLLKKSFIFFFFVGLAIFLLTILMSPLIKEFLHLEAEKPIILLGLILWLIPLSAVMAGGLRGLQKFGWIGTSALVDSAVRFGIGIIFLGILGLGIAGGMYSIMTATFLSFVVGFIVLVSILTKHKYAIDTKEIWKYGWPVFFTLIAIAFMANTDIVIVRHFFDPAIAGQYAVASVTATILFFTSNIFSFTMFPKVAELHSSGKDPSKLLKSNLFYMLIICVFMYILFHFSSDSVIKFFFGPQYNVGLIARTLIIAYSFLSLANILVIYDIAMGKSWYLYLLIAFAVLQPMLMWFWHPTIYTIVIIQVCTMTALFYILLIGAGRTLIFHQ